MSLRFLSFLIILLAGCLSAASAQSDAPTPVRDIDAVCGQCHADILKSYLKTPMANASGAAVERLIPGSFEHAASKVRYTITSDTTGSSGAAGAKLSYHLPGDPPVEGSAKLDYFLGSGHLGVTYLYSINGYLFESPIAYYSKLSGYDMKPGLETSPQMPVSLTLNDGCLRCHMSAAQKADPGTENHFSGLPFLHTGITCESCHGDTRRHVLTAGKSAAIDPLKLSPERRDSTCIVCHLEGDTRVERRGRAAIDYRPGDDIRDYLSFFAFKSENTTRRAVSEIEQFNSSMCKRTSGPAMSCMNCHDPHRSPEPLERAAFYRGKCLACHTGVKFAAQHYPQNPDCTSCHMPKNGAQNVLHVAWTDHRILRMPDKNQPQTLQEHDGDLEVILGAENSGRDLGSRSRATPSWNALWEC